MWIKRGKDRERKRANGELKDGGRRGGGCNGDGGGVDSEQKSQEKEEGGVSTVREGGRQSG